MRKTVGQNAFAKRMMERQMPESLNSDPDYRFFYDPPEMIQIVFGGRPWFLENDCFCVTRIGMFGGLGWSLPDRIVKTSGIDRVEVRIRKKHLAAKSLSPLFDMHFLETKLTDDPTAPPEKRVVTHRPGIAPERLKAVYAEVLGDHAI